MINYLLTIKHFIMKKLLFLLLLLVGCFFFPFRKCSKTLNSSIESLDNVLLRVDTFVLGSDSFLVFEKHLNGVSISVVPFDSFNPQN